jgi:cellobiose phosphorylase
MGRLFGFAYGHKENGAMFSHMATMYSNALYQQGFVEEGFEVIYDLYNHCMDFEVSKIYPGVPEYIDPKGRGMYHYLTGSASWLILTVLNEAYGVKGEYGDLLLEPKLTKPLFDDTNIASVKTLFGHNRLSIEYSLESLSEIRSAFIQSIEINGIAIEKGSHADVEINKQTILIKKEYLDTFNQEVSIRVYMK